MRFWHVDARNDRVERAVDVSTLLEILERSAEKPSEGRRSSVSTLLEILVKVQDCVACAGTGPVSTLLEILAHRRPRHGAEHRNVSTLLEILALGSADAVGNRAVPVSTLLEILGTRPLFREVYRLYNSVSTLLEILDPFLRVALLLLAKK